MNRSVPKYKLITWILLSLFWFLGTYMFPLQELVPSVAPGFQTGFNLVAECVIIALGLWTLNKRIDKILLISLMVISIISAIINGISISMYLNGMRNYLTMIFLLSTIRYLLATRERVEYFLPLMDKSLYIFLLLQMPVMVIQCIRWGAYDNVGGSLGWMMSGTISTLLYTVSFYLMIRRWDDSKSYLENLKKNIILLVALFPSMLNETKISFVYLMMYFFFLVPMDRKFVKRLLNVVPIIILFVVGFGYVYQSLLVNPQQDDADTNVTSWKFIEDYLLGNDDIKTLVIDGYMEAVLPEVQEDDFARGLKFTLLPIILSETPHSWVVGFGPSQFRGGTVMDVTKFASQYSWILKGSQMTVMVYVVDLGLLGLAWLVWYFFVLFRFGTHVKLRNKRLTWYMGLTILLSTVYMPIHLLQVFLIITIFISMLSSRWSIVKYVPKPSYWLLPEIKTDTLSGNEKK